MTVFCQLSVLYSTVTRDVDILCLVFHSLHYYRCIYACVARQHTALDTAVALFCHCLVCDVVNCTILNTTKWKLLHDKDQYDSVTDREIHVDMVARFDG